MVESIGTDSINHMLPDDDDSLSPFISGDLLKHTILFPSGNIFILFSFEQNYCSYHIFLIDYHVCIGNAASFNADDGFSTMKNSSESSENPSRPVSRYVSNDVYIFDATVQY